MRWKEACQTCGRDPYMAYMIENEHWPYEKNERHCIECFKKKLNTTITMEMFRVVPLNSWLFQTPNLINLLNQDINITDIGLFCERYYDWDLAATIFMQMFPSYTKRPRYA